MINLSYYTLNDNINYFNKIYEMLWLIHTTKIFIYITTSVIVEIAKTLTAVKT